MWGLRGVGLAVPGAILSALTAGCLDTPGDDGDGDGPPAQLLANPDFEDVEGWNFEGGVELGTTTDLGLPPSDEGPHVALLGRQDNQMDRLDQELTVPDSAQSLELAGVRCYATVEGFEMVYDTFTITIEPLDGGTPEILVDDSNLDASTDCEWLPFQRETTAFAGQRIRLAIEAQTDEAGTTSFAIDGLALTVSR